MAAPSIHAVNNDTDIATGECDMDLVRDLLIYLAEKKGRAHIQAKNIKIAGRTNEAFDYHLTLMYQAGFLNAEVQTTKTGRIIYVIPFELSYQGHQFLAPIRDENAWRQTRAAAKKVGALSVETVGDLVKSLLKKKINELTGGEFTI